jgi:hypothetical protein
MTFPNPVSDFFKTRPGPGADTGHMTTDIRKTPIHLGPGGTARPVEGFDWTPEALGAYIRATEADGPDGRLVMMFHMEGSWDQWECHPAGAEVVIACTGTHRFVQQIDGAEAVVQIGAGEALINPPGVWHTADTTEPGWILTITPGLGTDHRPR